MAPFLKGVAIYLRPIEATDIDRLLRWLHDVDTSRFLATGVTPIGRPQEEAWIAAAYSNDRDIPLAICRSADDAHIGTIGIHDVSWIDRRASVGLLIGELALRGNGYGTEALRLVIRYAFERLNLERLHLSVFDNNARAVGIYERLGFVEEGRLRQHRFRDGAYVDEIVMGLLRAEWSDRSS